MASGFLDYLRYVIGWGASPEAVAATVSQRYDLIGTDNRNLTLTGTQEDAFDLEGTSTKNFTLTGT